MQLTTEQLPDGVEKIVLAGRMDVGGVQEIDGRFTFLTTTRPVLIVVEISEVTFLASIGIRTLVSSAKALARRGGRMVLASPQPLVEEVLKLAQIHSFIPIYADVDIACASLKQVMGSSLKSAAGSN
jgi:anti-anti-sigma factor